MPSFRLHSRRDVLSGLACSVTATVAVLGGALLMFSEAGQSPWFEAGSALARDAERCQHEAAAQARHQCLRQVAASAAHDTDRTVVASRKPAAAPR